MNSCSFIGRLTDDPKQFGQDDNVISVFQIAIDRPYVKDDGSKDTDYPKFVAKGKLSHLTQRSLTRGTLVGIECSYQTRVDTRGDQNKYYDEFVVNRYTFIEKKKERS